MEIEAEPGNKYRVVIEIVNGRNFTTAAFQIKEISRTPSGDFDNSGFIGTNPTAPTIPGKSIDFMNELKKNVKTNSEIIEQSNVQNSV
ncbi:MAG: hypothetical protein LBT45_03470 [Rickettsiales bacterium]|nr:hypothetical protein [Rickettsiales bacterium]